MSENLETSSIALKVSHVQKSYQTERGELNILNEVNLDVRSGETIAIVGPSGSGKTTLLGLLAGLDTVTSGSIEINDVAFESLSEDERAAFRNEHIGFVFQNFQLLPTMTALENVMIPLELRNKQSPRERGIELLNQVNLGHRLDHYPIQLSGGEQQRVALARAFINEPKILFADEPTGNLDESTSALIVEQLFALNEQAGTTLIMVTHNLELANRLDRRFIIKEGKLVAHD